MLPVATLLYWDGYGVSSNMHATSQGDIVVSGAGFAQLESMGRRIWPNIFGVTLRN